MCDDTKIHNIIKVEKDASKEEKKTNYILTNVIHHDVTDIHGLLLLVVLAIHSVLTTTHMTLLLSHMLKIYKPSISTTITTAYHILNEENFK